MKNHTNKQSARLMLKDIVFGMQFDDLHIGYELSKRKQEQIIEEANKILYRERNLASKNAKPLDVVKTIRHDKIRVVMNEFPNGKICSIAYFDPKSLKQKGIIRINEEMTVPNNEEDFVLRNSRYITACMYGRYVLYHKKKHPFEISKKFENEQEELVTIQYFARCLLMPKELFVPGYDMACYLFKTEEEKVKCLAHAFRVPSSLIEVRLRELSLGVNAEK